MIIAVVTFEIDKKLNDTVLKEKFLETSPIYKDTPGLIRKNYICDTSKNLAGGVYCFDNLENAKSWFDEDRVKWITERYSAPDIKFYENPVIVDNNTDEIISWNYNMLWETSLWLSHFNQQFKLFNWIQNLKKSYNIAFIAAIRATPYTSIIIKRVFKEKPFIKDALASWDAW